MSGKKTIEDILIEDEIITLEQHDEITKYADKHDVSFIEALQAVNAVEDPRLIVQALAKSLDMTYLPIREYEISGNVLRKITGQIARHFQAVPISEDGGIITFAVPIKHATNLQVKDDLQRAANARHVEFVIAYGADIQQTIDDSYRADDELREIADQAEADAASADEALSVAEAGAIGGEIGEESKVIKFVELVLSQAIKDKASDIHFDPQERQLMIRYRIDGILYETTTAPASSIKEIVSRVKVMADLDISDRRTPQDGRLSLKIDNQKIDFRVATLPSVYGEKIVMRVLDNSAASLPLTALGINPADYKRLEDAATKPYGVVLVTGPTGSGKSTTLYSLLNRLVSPKINIITAEDPVEYRIPGGITQVQVNAKQGLTFERVLRTILRADPDVILVGEIRDEETANIVLQAGMTGHMVFSTLHTNDAASALSRLSEMGVEGFMIASTLEGVVSQRLTRKLCKFCKEEYVPTSLELETVGFPHDPKNLPTLYKPVGCKECSNTGYRGRQGVFEVLSVTPAIRDAILEGRSSGEIDEIAKSEGMTSMRTDGFNRVLDGITTIEEVLRVVS